MINSIKSLEEIYKECSTLLLSIKQVNNVIHNSSSLAGHNFVQGHIESEQVSVCDASLGMLSVLHSFCSNRLYSMRGFGSVDANLVISLLCTASDIFHTGVCCCYHVTAQYSPAPLSNMSIFQHSSFIFQWMLVSTSDCERSSPDVPFPDYFQYASLLPRSTDLWGPEFESQWRKKGLQCGALPATSTSRQAAVLLKGPVCLLPHKIPQPPPPPRRSHIHLQRPLDDLLFLSTRHNSMLCVQECPARRGFPHPWSNAAGKQPEAQPVCVCVCVHQ